MSKSKLNHDAKPVQGDVDPLLSYAWHKPKGGRSSGGDVVEPRCSLRKNNTLAIDFPLSVLAQAGIEPESRIAYMLTDDDPKAMRIEAGGTLKVRVNNKRSKPFAFITVTIPAGLALTGTPGMAALEDVVVDGNAIAFRLPGDLAFAPAGKE